MSSHIHGIFEDKPFVDNTFITISESHDSSDPTTLPISSPFFSTGLMDSAGTGIHLGSPSVAVSSPLPISPPALAAPAPSSSSKGDNANANDNNDNNNDDDEDSGSSPPAHRLHMEKPHRSATKDEHGKYPCTYDSCKEIVRAFSRKCEYNKHMDKHERPYQCQAKGCEKLPGFTYSGGLVRHEREVHGLHGGPKNPLHCPHGNCKRNSGKGFSRQENLNEHLRRVHTQDGSATISNDESEGDPAEKILTGQKRKRSCYTNGDDLNYGEELRQLRLENQDLKRQLEVRNSEAASMLTRITKLEAAVQTKVAPAGSDLMQP